jgi:hypothetical protein
MSDQNVATSSFEPVMPFPSWVPTSVGAQPSHSLMYLIGKIESMNWQSGITKHLQQYNAFLVAASACIPIDVAFEIVTSKLDNVGAQMNGVAIKRQCERAYQYIDKTSSQVVAHEALTSRAPTTAFSYQTLVETTTGIPPISHERLRALSPLWVENGYDFLAALFRPEDKVAVFKQFEATRPTICAMAKRMSLDGMQYFLSNPVDGEAHPNPRNGNKTSMRSMESVTRFEYAVLESDHEQEYPGANDCWLRYLVALRLPIVSISTSGGKSIHALVRFGARDKEHWDEMRRQLLDEVVLHGADRAALTAVRLTRLPFGTNKKTGRPQELLYLNPDSQGGPIYEC